MRYCSRVTMVGLLCTVGRAPCQLSGVCQGPQHTLGSRWCQTCGRERPQNQENCIALAYQVSSDRKGWYSAC